MFSEKEEASGSLVAFVSCGYGSPWISLSVLDHYSGFPLQQKFSKYRIISTILSTMPSAANWVMFL